MTKPFELNMVDKRMLQLPGILKKAGLIKYNKEFLEVINMKRQNFTNIPKTGSQHFTVSQVILVCDSFGSYDEMKKKLLLWVFGLVKKNPLQSIKQKRVSK